MYFTLFLKDIEKFIYNILLTHLASIIHEVTFQLDPKKRREIFLEKLYNAINNWEHGLVVSPEYEKASHAINHHFLSNKRNSYSTKRRFLNLVREIFLKNKYHKHIISSKFHQVIHTYEMHPKSANNFFFLHKDSF